MVSLASICSSSSRCSLRLWPLVLASSSSASSNCLFKALTLLLTLSTWQQQHSIRYCHHSCQINIIISHNNIYNNRVETIVSSSRGNTDIWNQGLKSLMCIYYSCFSPSSVLPVYYFHPVLDFNCDVRYTLVVLTKALRFPCRFSLWLLLARLCSESSEQMIFLSNIYNSTAISHNAYVCMCVCIGVYKPYTHIF